MVAHPVGLGVQGVKDDLPGLVVVECDGLWAFKGCRRVVRHRQAFPRIVVEKMVGKKIGLSLPYPIMKLHTWSQSYDRDYKAPLGKSYNTTSSLVRYKAKTLYKHSNR
jgi:hypothetical protein